MALLLRVERSFKVNTVDKLLELQKRDCTIRDIKQELQDIPARQKEEEVRLDEHKLALAEAEEGLKAEQASIADVELEISSSNEKISKLRQQQLDLKTNKEFRAMEDEIKAVLAGITNFEDNQLLLMENLEQANGIVEEKRKALAEEATAVESDKQVHGERATELERELKTLEDARVSEAADIDTEWLSRYDLIIERKDRAMVLVDNGICGGCHMQLPPAVIHAAAAHNDMVFCDHCGRLLY
jgi:predicted  nucleic acid-binding Zn-ribbon protein